MTFGSRPPTAPQRKKKKNPGEDSDDSDIADNSLINMG